MSPKENNKYNRTETFKNFSKNLIVKFRPIINKRKTWGYEVKLIDFASHWSRVGGPEVTSKFFLRESDARQYAEKLSGHISPEASNG